MDELTFRTLKNSESGGEIPLSTLLKLLGQKLGLGALASSEKVEAVRNTLDEWYKKLDKKKASVTEVKQACSSLAEGFKAEVSSLAAKVTTLEKRNVSSEMLNEGILNINAPVNFRSTPAIEEETDQEGLIYYDITNKRWRRSGANGWETF